jgi:hypothetical protein
VGVIAMIAHHAPIAPAINPATSELCWFVGVRPPKPHHHQRIFSKIRCNLTPRVGVT